MTIHFMKSDFDKEARIVSCDIRQETGRPAKIDHWELLIDGSNVTLAVIVNAYDGKRQRNIVIC